MLLNLHFILRNEFQNNEISVLFLIAGRHKRECTTKHIDPIAKTTNSIKVVEQN